MKLKNNFILTGATGILGSHILFELLKQKLNDATVDHIYLPVRKSKSVSDVKERIRFVLANDYIPQYLNSYSTDYLLNQLEIIEADLTQDYNWADTVSGKCVVIHCAGSTNLSRSDEAGEEVFKLNFQASQSFFHNVKSIASRFVYISTAFSCGSASSVDDDFLKLQKSSYRNPYESIKAETEKWIVNEAEKYNIDWQILRPSVICGRLLDPPYYFTPKFDVFYGWIQFFHRFAPKIKGPLRLKVNLGSGLNVVPVDLVSRVVVRASLSDTIKQLNIASPQLLYFSDLIQKALTKLNIRDFYLIDKEPEKMNTLERLYYNTVGKIYDPYLSQPATQLDVRLLHSLLSTSEKEALKVIEKIDDLVRFAMEKEFRESY